jgi:hypothetical protein
LQSALAKVIDLAKTGKDILTSSIDVSTRVGHPLIKPSLLFSFYHKHTFCICIHSFSTVLCTSSFT